MAYVLVVGGGWPGGAGGRRLCPAIPSANTNLPTNLPTIVIAERVASWSTAERHES